MKSSGNEAENVGTSHSVATLDVLNALANSGLTLPGLSRLLVEWIVRTLPARRCVFALDHPRGPRILFEAVAGDTRVRVRVNGDFGAAKLTCIDADPDVQCNLDDSLNLTEAVTRSRLETAVRHCGDTFGIVWADAEPNVKFDEQHRETIEAFARQMAFLFAQRFAMEQARNQATRDELTGLYNRRYIHRALAWVIPRAREQRYPVSLLLLDVDHFKQFNDTWGHATGDRVLRMLGDLMRSLFRTHDVVCRYGGEEFAVLLCDHRTSEWSRHPTQVMQFAERLRKEAELLTLTSPDGQILSHVTVSGGIATFPWDAGSAEELIQKADEALYRAKRHGRNRIFLVNPQRLQQAA